VKVFNEMMDMNVKGMTNVLHSGKEDGGDNSEHVFWMGKVGAMLVAPYCASKLAIKGLSKSGKRGVGRYASGRTQLEHNQHQHALLLLWCIYFSLSSTAGMGSQGCNHDSQSHSS